MTAVARVAEVEPRPVRLMAAAAGRVASRPELAAEVRSVDGPFYTLPTGT